MTNFSTPLSLHICNPTERYWTRLKDEMDQYLNCIIASQLLEIVGRLDEPLVCPKRLELLKRAREGGVIIGHCWHSKSIHKMQNQTENLD